MASREIELYDREVSGPRWSISRELDHYFAYPNADHDESLRRAAWWKEAAFWLVFTMACGLFIALAIWLVEL